VRSVQTACAYALVLLASCSDRDALPCPEPDAGQDAAAPVASTVDEGCQPLLPEEVVFDSGDYHSMFVPVRSEAAGGAAYVDVLYRTTYVSLPGLDLVYCPLVRRYRVDPAAGVVASAGSTCVSDEAAERLTAAALRDPATYYHCRIVGDYEVRVVPVGMPWDCSGWDCEPYPTHRPAAPFVYVRRRPGGELSWSEGPALRVTEAFEEGLCSYVDRVVLAPFVVLEGLDCCRTVECGHPCGTFDCSDGYACSPEVRYESPKDGYCHAIGSDPR